MQLAIKDYKHNLWPILVYHITAITNDWPSNFQKGLILCKVFGILSANFLHLILNSVSGLQINIVKKVMNCSKKLLYKWQTATRACEDTKSNLLNNHSKKTGEDSHPNIYRDSLK